MRCSKCGKELENGVKTCPECGTEVVADENMPDEKQQVTPDLEGKKDEQSVVRKKVNPLPFIIIGIVAVAMIAVAITGILVISSPKAKYEKQLSLGNKYLDELDYEQAIAAYYAAIEIDPNDQRAYEGLANAYKAQVDLLTCDEEPEVVLAYVESACTELDKIHTSENDIFLASITSELEEKKQEFQPKDTEEKTVENPENNESSLADSEKEEEEDISVSADLVEEEPKEPAYIYTEQSEKLLQDVYELMSKGDYQTVAFWAYRSVYPDNCEFESCPFLKENMKDNEKAKAVAGTLADGEHIIWAPDVFTLDYSGTAVGIYKVGDDGFYFYYGDYKNGIREGQGVSVYGGGSPSRIRYVTFNGLWSSDAPNGYGEEVWYYLEERWNDEYNDYVWNKEYLNLICTTKGNFTNGLENGNMVASELLYEGPCDDSGHEIHNVYYEGSYTAENGYAEAVGNEWHYTEEDVLYCYVYPKPSVQQGVDLANTEYYSYQFLTYQPASGGKLGIYGFY